MVASACLFVIADQVNKTSAVFHYAWGEAFRAVLLQEKHSSNAAVMFVQSNQAGGRDETYPAFITNEDEALSAPLAETLAHWLAGDSSTMLTRDARPFRIDRISFDIPVPALQDTLNVTIQKKSVKDLYEYGDSSAIDFSTLSSLHEGPRSEWPTYARAAFFRHCAGKQPVQGFRTEQHWIQRRQGQKGGPKSGTHTVNHAVRMHDFDFIVSLRIRGYGFLSPMTLHTTYSLRYTPDPESEDFMNPEDVEAAADLVSCHQFVPEMSWIDGSEHVWREYGRLSAQGLILDYLTEDFAPRPEALEKLLEQARAGVSGIPTVSDSLPASLVLKLAPWIAIFLAIVGSRSIRVLEQASPGSANDAFFGRSLGPSPKLSCLDGRAFRAVERGVRGSLAIAAALAPFVVAMSAAAASCGLLIFSPLIPLPGPGVLLAAAVLLTRYITSEPVVFVQVVMAMLCSMHLVGTIWRSATRDRTASLSG